MILGISVAVHHPAGRRENPLCKLIYSKKKKEKIEHSTNNAVYDTCNKVMPWRSGLSDHNLNMYLMFLWTITLSADIALRVY